MINALINSTPDEQEAMAMADSRNQNMNQPMYSALTWQSFLFLALDLCSEWPYHLALWT
jgi:hypothetical protein